MMPDASRFQPAIVAPDCEPLSCHELAFLLIAAELFRYAGQNSRDCRAAAVTLRHFDSWPAEDAAATAFATAI